MPRHKKAIKGEDQKGKYYKWGFRGKKFYYGPDEKLSATEAKAAAKEWAEERGRAWLAKYH